MSLKYNIGMIRNIKNNRFQSIENLQVYTYYAFFKFCLLFCGLANFRWKIFPIPKNTPFACMYC